ncbi:MAG: helix-turn-helix domain-containing protein [Sodaliphilus sp.]
MKPKHYIQALIEEGEHEHQDFKYQISDAKKIARSISAFANHSGGRLLVGVKDNGHIAGVRSEEEMYMIEQAASMYCRPAQKLKFDIYNVEGKTVLLAEVAEAPEKPVQAPDEGGKWRVYFRVADENVLASGLHVKAMKHIGSDEGALVSFSEKEKELLVYLDSHGGITLSGFSKLAHISRFAAEEVLLNLLEMKVVKLSYHNGECLITKA